MAKAAKELVKQQKFGPSSIVTFTDDEYDIQSVLAVHNLEASAALVAAGMGDCYLVKDEEGHVITLFRLTHELLDVVQHLKDKSLSLNIDDYWNCIHQAVTAQSDIWPHETTDRE